MANPHRRRPALRFFLWFSTLALALLLFLLWSNRSLQVTYFDLAFSNLPEGFDGFRAAVVADTHNARFGSGNHRLFAALDETEPEAIFFPGDLPDSYRGEEAGYARELAAGLSAIAPTYYVTGNHEWAIGHVREQKAVLRENGVTVLTNTCLPLERNGDVLLLAGVDDPNGPADQKTPEELFSEISALGGDPFTVLLAHRNNYFASQYSRLGADLVILGHGHGGVVRLPGTDGLFGHGDFLPTCTAGVYEANGSTAFVTRGLGNSGVSFRLFNRPEIAILTLHRAD